MDFRISSENGYPSIALNPGDEDAEIDVRERGRLKYSADSVDFFSEGGEAGISASNRIKGVVLHEILSRMTVAEDLESAARVSSSIFRLSTFDSIDPYPAVSKRPATFN